MWFQLLGRTKAHRFEIQYQLGFLEAGPRYRSLCGLTRGCEELAECGGVQEAGMVCRRCRPRAALISYEKNTIAHPAG